MYYCYCHQGYESLKHIAKLGGISVPQHILDIVEPIKDNDDAVRGFGIDFATNICRAILDSGSSYGLHFYTLNREVRLFFINLIVRFVCLCIHAVCFVNL